LASEKLAVFVSYKSKQAPASMARQSTHRSIRLVETYIYCRLQKDYASWRSDNTNKKKTFQEENNSDSGGKY